jgi:hypothetical protein
LDQPLGFVAKISSAITPGEVLHGKGRMLRRETE